MRKIIDNDYFTIVSRLLIGGMFIYASYYKIVEPGDFAKSIWYYHIVPGKFINLMAIVLPWLELLAGLGLILGIFFRGASLWVNVTMLVFTFALASTIWRGLSIDCGCFKASEAGTHAAWEPLIRDIISLIFTLQLLFTRSRRWMLSRN
ncbi:MAG TPA: MauE/DoxX family redox-associated membrane protein [Candidatus Acidoferrum sp.]|nr:MauE/DoxX family redox-associated membrane protein [Candidatus Acidoferrum sp.]